MIVSEAFSGPPWVMMKMMSKVLSASMDRNRIATTRVGRRSGSVMDGEDGPVHREYDPATTGLIARAIETTGTRGVSVAPRAKSPVLRTPVKLAAVANRA